MPGILTQIPKPRRYTAIRKGRLWFVYGCVIYLTGCVMASSRYVAPSEFAAVYAALGHNDAAFEWLERAYEERDAMDLLNVWPGYDPLRSDPCFDDLLRRMNFPE